MTDTPPTAEDTREAQVVSEYLDSGYTASFDGTYDASEEASASAPDLTEPNQESSLKLQGGDIHRNLYKIDARQKLHKRAATFSHPENGHAEDEESMTVSEQLAPGGFRREFLQQRRNTHYAARIPITRDFVEFLDLYGSFAGEDLADSDEDETATEDLESDRDDDEPSERRPLLGRKRTSRVANKGDATTTRTFFTLLKAFIGTGIMFLPKAFNNGGIIFSSITLLSVSVISMTAFHLLLQCRNRYGGGYGEIGQAIGGSKMRAVILASVTISQLGFVCSGIIFTADNLYSFLEAVAKGESPLSSRVLIALQMAVLIPLGFVRNISKLGPAALLADVFILIGLTYIYYYDIASLATNGLNPTVQSFNPERFTLTIGASIFTFEGIGLILPIQSSMKEPQRFEWLLAVVMGIITVIFASVGILCYATFGADTNIEIITNYPQDNKLVNAVQFLYAIAVLVGTPVQLFPAIRIIEGKIFGRVSGKKDLKTKWKKNAFRTFVVLVCTAVSIAGSSSLDRFVALIGSFACVPLVYIYPPLLHYKGVASNKIVKAGDIMLMTLGFVGMVYTTVVTVVNSFLQ